MKIQFILASLCLTVNLYAAQLCPKEVRLPDLPVHDQDGLGTCYSNVASLMMQHKFKLEKAPSYQQMAMLTTSLDKGKDSNLTKVGETEGKEELFSSGGYECKVFNDAQTYGWCDADQFGLDVINENDSLEGQNFFLVKLAKILEKNNDSLVKLTHANPDEFQNLKHQLARLLTDKEKICQKSFRDLVIERLTGKIYIKWNRHLKSLVGEKRERFAKLMKLSFDQNGTASKKFISFLDKGFLENNLEKDGQNYYQNKKMPKAAFKKEPIVFIWWALENKIDRNGIEPPKFDKTQDSFFPYANEAEIYGSCFTKGGEVADVFSCFLQNEKLPSSTSILPQKNITLAEKYLEIMKRMGKAQSRQEKYRDFMDLVFPRCGEQLEQRKDPANSKISCVDKINDNKNETINHMVSELCNMNPVGISVCGDFLKSDQPVDLKKCDKAVLNSMGMKRGLHAMSVVGYKTSDSGKRLFLIQNSWGRTCPFMKDNIFFKKNYTGLVECEERDGMPTGRFWIEENLLLDNTTQIAVLSETR